VVLGTVDYIAPEQADSARQADIRSDIYSLGCTLYHLLAGRPPFPTGTPLQKVRAHVEKKPQPLTELRDDLPEELMPVLERMMAKNPRHRYQTPAEVAIALEPFTFAAAAARKGEPRLGASKESHSRTLVLEKSPAYHRSGHRIVALAAALLFIVAGLLGGAVYRIATDKGELVITTESEDVKVVITQGGKLIDIIDTKTDKQISLALRSGVYELELKGAPEGLKLDIDRATLTRGEKVLATITKVTPKQARYLTLPIDKVASAVSTKSLFSGGDHERLIFPKWGKQEVFGIPFDVIDPQGASVKNAIVLYGPGSPITREYPLTVSLKCGSRAKAIHLLSGVAGGGSPRGDDKKTVCLFVRLHYRDGRKEDHELINGVHFCDFFADGEKRLPDVPGSRLAIRLVELADRPIQMRYLAIQPKNPTKVIEEIEFIKGMKGDTTTPVIMAVTVERPVRSAEKGGEARRLVDRLVGHTDQPWKAAFLPDGKRVLSAGFDKVLRLWDAETGRELRRFDGHSEAIAALAISPDGRLALSGGGASQTNPPAPWVSGKDLNLRLWDLTSGNKIRDFEGHTGIIWCLAFSPDGRRALSGSMDHTARLWDVATGREVRRFQHNDLVMGVCFSPDGKWGLSSTEGGDIVLWELEAGRDLRHFKGHHDGVECVAFSPDGHQVVSAGRDGTVRLWDVRTGNEIRRLADNMGQQCDIAFSRDGRRALTGGTNHTFRLLDVETGKELNRYVSPGGGNVQCVAFSPDGRTALSVCHSDLAVCLWPLPDPPPARKNP
jgi:WD40 repeat protein